MRPHFKKVLYTRDTGTCMYTELGGKVHSLNKEISTTRQCILELELVQIRQTERES